MHNFKMIAIRGTEKWEIDCDTFRVETEDGQHVELYPRKSDGEINLSAKDQLTIHPVASNAARVSSARHRK